MLQIANLCNNLFSQDSGPHSIYNDNNINSHIGNSNILPTLIRGSRQSLKDVLQIPNNIQPNNQNNQAIQNGQTSSNMISTHEGPTIVVHSRSSSVSSTSIV